MWKSSFALLAIGLSACQAPTGIDSSQLATSNDPSASPASPSSPTSAPLLQTPTCSSGQTAVTGSPGFCIDDAAWVPNGYTTPATYYNDGCSFYQKTVCSKAQIQAACQSGAVSLPAASVAAGIWTSDSDAQTILGSTMVSEGYLPVNTNIQSYDYSYQFALDSTDCTHFTEVTTQAIEHFTTGGQHIFPESGSKYFVYCCEE